MGFNGLRKKILLIEDEESLVKALTIRLRASGYEVFYAFDVLQGVQKARREKPGLIILDIRIPGGDGFLVAQRLNNSIMTRDIPVIFLTGLPESEGKKKALELGAKFYIKKPYDPDDLLDKVKTALALGESQQSVLKKVTPKKIGSLTKFIPTETRQKNPFPAELKPAERGLSLKCPICGRLDGDPLCRC
jgi:two-component system chemotaxis response regulator CheY